MTTSVRKTVDNACCFRPLSDGTLRVIYEITRKCNLICKHCMVDDEYEQLSKDRMMKLMHELPEVAASKIMFTGGEPLRIHSIPELVAIASSYGIITDLNSNLTLLERSIAKELRQAGLSEATTSLDGSAESHNLMRRNTEAYGRTIRGINYLVEEGIPVDVVCIVTNDTVNYLNDVAEAVFQNGASSITYSGLIIKGRATIEMCPDDETVTQAIDKVRSQFDKPIRTVRLLNKDFSECHKGQDIIGIDAEGYVHPCLLSTIGKYINLNDYSLNEAITLLKDFRGSQKDLCED